MDARDKCDQVVRECLLKIAQVILQSRVSFQPTERKKINKWFNTELDEIERVAEELIPTWRSNIYQPIFLDIMFQPNRSTNVPPNYSPLMERWKIHYDPGSGNRDIELPTMYKHLVLVIRSLYGSLRLMPSYHVFKNCNKNKTGANMTYTFSTEENTRIMFPAPPSGLTLGPVSSPFGVLSLGALYKEDCSFEVRSSHESLLSAQIIIKDYQPEQQAHISQSPSRGMDIPQRPESNPYEAARSAPIGIPGRGRSFEEPMPVISPPSSLTTARYSASPFQNAMVQQPSSKYSSSLPNQGPMFNTPPLSTGLPSSYNNNSNNLFNYGTTATSTNSSNSNSSASSTGSTPFNYISPSPYSTTPSNPSPITNNNFVPTTGYTPTGQTPTNTNPYLPTGSGTTHPAARPRASSHAPPLSTTPPFSMPLGPPLSNSAIPLQRSNSVSSKSPPFRLSISPFKEPPFGGVPESHPTMKPARPPSVKMGSGIGGLLGPSMIFETGDSLLNKDKGALVSSANTSAASSGVLHSQDEPAFATMGSISADSEIGEFIKMCQAAPPLKLFSMVESRTTVSRLLSENSNYTDLSKLETLDLNVS